MHIPSRASGAGLVLTHGAGGNCNAPLLVAAAAEFCAAGVHVLRFDLAFRQRKPSGPPPRNSGADDRQTLQAAVSAMRDVVSGKVIMSGHSYGGRQGTMLAVDAPRIADALLLFSYPLHPPAKPAQLRTEHFPQLRVPAIFVHGSKDLFATDRELRTAVAAIPAHTRIVSVDGADHSLKQGRFDLAAARDAVFDAIAR